MEVLGVLLRGVLMTIGAGMVWVWSDDRLPFPVRAVLGLALAVSVIVAVTEDLERVE